MDRRRQTTLPLNHVELGNIKRPYGLLAAGHIPWAFSLGISPKDFMRSFNFFKYLNFQMGDGMDIFQKEQTGLFVNTWY
jgi:hypothetical protein